MSALNILSLGAGVQSTTVLLMSCRGELPKLDAAIFADTQWEPAAVYEHLDWLTAEAARATIPVQRVSAGALRAAALTSQVNGRKTDGVRWASMPLFVKNVYTAADLPALRLKITARKQLGKPSDRLSDIVAEICRYGQATRIGMIKRQCTSEYKIEPIERYVKTELLGLKPRARWPREVVVQQYYGISADEPQRMRDSPAAWKRHIYPLCGVPTDLLPKPMTRLGCKRWLARHYPDRTIPRSACLGCPFHHDDEWRDIRSRPDEWADVVYFDRTIRNSAGLQGQAFLHRSCVPLDEVDLSTPEERGQGSFGFAEECTGSCGV